MTDGGPAGSAPTGGTSNAVLAIAFMLGGALSNAALAAMVRGMSGELHPFELAFFRSVFGLLVLCPVFLRHGFNPLRTEKLKVHLFRGCLTVVTMLAYFTALSMVPLAKIAALDFSGPLFATVLAVILLGEVIRIRRIMALVVGFAGAMVIIRPGFVALDVGALLALGAAAIWGVALVTVRYLGRTETSLTTTLYMGIIVTPLSFVAAIPFWRSPTLAQLGLLAVIGATGTVTHLCVNQSLRLADAGTVMPVQFTRLLWAAVFGFALFGEIPDVWTWIGGTMIFSAVTYITYRERQVEGAEARPPSAPTSPA